LASLLERFRAGFWHTALGPAVVIWGFGYLLVDIVAFLLRGSTPGLTFAAALPMLALGIGLTLTLDCLREILASTSAALRWAVLLPAILTATAVQSLFDTYWMRWVSLTLVPEWQSWALIITLERLFTVGTIYLWTFSLALILLWATRIRGSAEAAVARTEASLHRAEAAALRLQLNPHFLFNTLNSISSLVVVGRKDEAEEMIDLLSDFLRASLNTDPMADVPLGQEIDTIDAYLGIEASRFGDRLEVEIDADPATAKARVPNFILQPLVENAIKHGVAAVRGTATVRVAAARQGDTLVLSVVNIADSPAAAEPSEPRPGTGIGLANIRQRLANAYGDRATLETGEIPGGYRAVIRLPFAPQPR